MTKVNFAFFGTPDVASNTLNILAESGYIPTVIITTPDRRAGRGMHVIPTPVSMWADSHNIKCLKPEKIDSDFIDQFKKLDIDLSIVIAYGKILPQELIISPNLGTINIHYSLLPKYRGASPVQQSLLNGDTTTGVSIQQMEFKLDSGPILAETKVTIDPDETKVELLSRLCVLGAELLTSKLPDILNQEIQAEDQVESDATYCTKIKKEDGLIDIYSNPIENYNKYRAFQDWPGTYFFVNKNGKDLRIKIKKAKLENGSFAIERVIPEGKKEISYDEFLKSITLK